MIDVLTDEQLKVWRQMTGEPFKGQTFPFGPPPEFGGRGPGRGGPPREPWRDDKRP